MGAEMCEPTPEVTGSTVTDSTDIDPVPKKRGKSARYISIIICAIAAILVLTFCIINREEDVYYPNKEQKNTTNNYYRKEKKTTFPGLFTTALGLFSVVVGTLVDRLSLLFEERHHRRARYSGSWKKMIKACFSGIVWGPVFALLGFTLIIVMVLIFLTDRPVFQLSYLVYIFSGIGVGPLIMHLLNLNTESAVYISTILEEKGVYVANGLAWSYYFNYLKKALPKFEEAVNRTEGVNLFSNKLLLLVPLNCDMEDLSKLDNKIKKSDVNIWNGKDPYYFPVYQLTVNERETKEFAIQYVEEPLQALRDMSLLDGYNAVKIETCDEEVKLLYRTLVEILAHRKALYVQQMCILVPIKAKNRESLQDGGLVKCIMDVVNRSPTQTDGPLAFVKVEKNKQLSVDVSQPKKATDKSSHTDHTRVIKNDKKKEKAIKFDQNVRDKQDDMNINEKGKKGKKLRRKYKENTPKKTEREELIPARENVDSSDPNNSAPNKAQRLVQETGDEVTDSGATTSGINTEMVHIANGSQQSYQQEEQSSNDKQNETEL